VLDDDGVGLEEGAYFVGIGFPKGILSAVTFGDNDGGAVCADMSDDDTLKENAGLPSFPIYLLSNPKEVLLLKDRGLQGFHLHDILEGGEPVEDCLLCVRGEAYP
jgi:hypothetical protein